MSAVEPDEDLIRKHLAWWFARCNGLLSIVRIPYDTAPRSVTCAPKAWDHAARSCAEISTSGNNLGPFVRVTTLSTAPSKGRGEENLTAEIPGVWLDIDIDAPGHRAPDEKVLPPSLAAAEEVLAECPFTPGLITGTGGGLHVWWRFPEPIDVRDDARRVAANRALDRVADAWEGRFTARGWHLDRVADMARVLRPAGGVRSKRGIEPNVVTVHRRERDAEEVGMDEWLAWANSSLEECPVPIVEKSPPARRFDLGLGKSPLDFVLGIATADLLDGAALGPWEYAGEDRAFEYWARGGTANRYSIKRSLRTGLFIVWSSAVTSQPGMPRGLIPGDAITPARLAAALHGITVGELASRINEEVRERCSPASEAAA